MNRSLPGWMPGLCAFLVGSLAGPGAWAQNELPGKPELSAEERAQKQADKVFTFIKLQAIKPAPKRATADAPVSAPPVQAASTVQAKAAPKLPVRVAAASASETRAPLAPAAESAAARPAAYSAQGPEALAAVGTGAATLPADPIPASPKAEPEPPPLLLLSKVEPEIPRQLQADFKGGAVTVQFTVKPDGTVGQAQAVQASHKRLAVAAVTAVNQWRFAPLPTSREASVDIAFAVD